MEFISVHWLLKFEEIPTDVLYYNIKFLQLKQRNSDMFRPFVGQLQGVDIIIYKNHCL